ncbi:MAG: DUF1223 domain-containing protein [Acidobacteriota bacterium]
MLKRSLFLSAVAACGVALVALSVSPFPPAVQTALAEEEIAFGTSDRSRHTVVVELFTSQGCSSCPPADFVLSSLAGRGGVIALAFHVDYWNRLGWRDPFSSPRWTERQRSYAEQLESSVYTPQLVVDGRAHVVGSVTDDVQDLLVESMARPDTARVYIEPEADVDGWTLDVTARLPPAAELVAIVTESRQFTDVSSGENRDRRLRHDRVVRTLETLEVAPGSPDGPARPAWATWRIEPDPAWVELELTAIVFAQDPKTLEIYGATETVLPRRPPA